MEFLDWLSNYKRLISNKTGNVKYKRNTEACSSNHCCCNIQAISITHSDCVFVVLGIEHVMLMRRIVICGLPCSTIRTDGHMTPMKKRIVTYRNFANAPKYLSMERRKNCRCSISVEGVEGGGGSISGRACCLEVSRTLYFDLLRVTRRWNKVNLSYVQKNQFVPQREHSMILFFSPIHSRASWYYQSFIYSPTDAPVSCLKKTLLKFTLKQLRHVSVLQLHHHQGAR